MRLSPRLSLRQIARIVSFTFTIALLLLVLLSIHSALEYTQPQPNLNSYSYSSNVVKTTKVTPPLRDSTIHLLNQWYWPKHRNRAIELTYVLARNVNNSHIHTIHLIQNIEPYNKTLYFAPLRWIDPFFPWDLMWTKLVISSVADINRKDGGVIQRRRRLHRLQIADALEYASAIQPTAIIAILANQDIHFDDTISLLRTSPESDLSPYTAYFLSRRETQQHLPYINDPFQYMPPPPDQCGPAFMGSHDAFVFLPPVPDSAIFASRGLEMGAWGVEARLLWEFEQLGMEGRNPCEDVLAWHVHRKMKRMEEDDDKILHRMEPDDDEWLEIRQRALMGLYDSTQLQKKGVQVEEDERGDAGRVPMPEVNTDGRSSVAFPEGLKRKLQ